MAKFTIPNTRFNKYNKTIEDIYNTSLPVIAILLSFYALWIGESQGQKRPKLELTFKCQRDSVEKMSGMYYYDIYLTNYGDIDAQVTMYKMDFHQYVDGGNENALNELTIPTNTSKQILQKRGESTDHPNYILADYIISYKSINGNGDFISNDTIFCK